MRRYVVFLLLVLAAACTRTGDSAPRGDLARQPQLVGKVWLSTDSGAPPGTIRIFLANGTLLMDSCGETYRLAEWRSLDERRIEWTEDSERIEAQIVRLTDEEFQLRLQLRGETKTESYRPAQVPTVCPDMPR
jgi:hypothetical protein